MWKINLLFAWIYATVTISLAYAIPSHLQSLKSHYPYGLIGDDYGILTLEDLAVNTCNTSEIAPFSEGKNMNYSYWQCFALKDTQMKWDSLGYDIVEKKETGHLEIEVLNKQEAQSYIARDAMDIQDYKEYFREWKRKTRNEKYVCISGSFGRLGEGKNNRKEMVWVFDKFKTRKGCESHRSECTLKEVTKELRQNCIVHKNKHSA